MMYNGFVYLAKSDTGHYKIGRSKNPYERIKHFDTIMPVKVGIVHYFPCDDPKEAESKLHEWAGSRWGGRRVAGEWFELFDWTIKSICNIRHYLNHEFYQPVTSISSKVIDVYPCCNKVLEIITKEKCHVEFGNDNYWVSGEWFDIDLQVKRDLEANYG